MEKSRKPKIRFKGFTDDWEQRELGNIGQTYTGLSGKTKDDFGHGHAQFVTYMNVFSNPICNPKMNEPIEVDSKQNEVEVGDVFFTTSSETPKEVGMTSVLIEKQGKMYLNSFCFGYRLYEKYDSYYLAYMLRSNSFREKIIMLAQGISRYNISKNKVMEIDVFVPSYKEQMEIGKYFRDLDTLITLHQRKLDKLVNVKKSMLEKMFPQQGSRIPEIRFCGFTDDWEQRKLVELLTKYTDEVNVPHNGYERLGIRSHAKGTFHSYVSEGHELQTGKMHKVAADKFIVNITFGWEHAVAVTDKNDAGKLVSHRFPQYSLSENLYSKFFKYIILDDKFKHHLWLSSPGGAGRNRVLKLDEMLEYKIKIPNVQEQQKIAEVLMDLDHLITLHQRKLEKLKNIKKSMLEKMFI